MNLSRFHITEEEVKMMKRFLGYHIKFFPLKAKETSSWPGVLHQDLHLNLKVTFLGRRPSPLEGLKARSVTYNPITLPNQPYCTHRQHTAHPQPLFSPGLERDLTILFSDVPCFHPASLCPHCHILLTQSPALQHPIITGVPWSFPQACF